MGDVLVDLVTNGYGSQQRVAGFGAKVNWGEKDLIEVAAHEPPLLCRVRTAFLVAQGLRLLDSDTGGASMKSDNPVALIDKRKQISTRKAKHFLGSVLDRRCMARGHESFQNRKVGHQLGRAGQGFFTLLLEVAKGLNGIG